MADSRTQAQIEISAVNRTAQAFAAVKADLAGLGDSAQGIAGKLEAMSGAVAALAGVAALGGLAQRFKAIVDGVDAFNDLSDATGASIANLAALEDVAARTGTSFNTVGAALTKLNQSLNGATADSATAQALRAIGLSAQELKDQDPALALQRVAVALAGFADDGSKARLEMTLFGRSSREVAPLLKDLAENGLGAAGSLEEQAKQADRFNKQLAQLGKNATDASRALVGNLLPALNDSIARFRIAARELGTFGALLELGPFGSRITDAAEGVRKFAAEVARLQQERDRLASDSRPVVQLRNQARLESIDAELAKAKQLESVYRRIFAGEAPDLGQSDPRELARRGRGPAALPSVVVPTLGEDRPGAAAADRAAQYLETLRKQLEGTRDLTAAEKALNDIRSGSLGSVTAAQQARILGLAQEIDATKQAEAVARARSDARRAEYEGILEFERRVADERRRTIDSLLSQTPAGRSSALRDQLAMLNEELDRRGGDSTSALGQAIQNVQQQLRDLEPVAVKANETLDVFADQAARNIQNMLGDTLLRTATGSFNGIVKAWGDMILKLLVQAQAAQLNKALFGDNPGQTIGNLIGSLLGATRGSASLPVGSIPRPFSTPQGGAATGSNALERDMITLVHRGEAVVPKKYNPALGGSRVTVNNYGSDEVKVRERDDGGLDIDIMTKLVAQRIAADVSSARGPVSGALKSRGLNSSASLARMG